MSRPDPCSVVSGREISKFWFEFCSRFWADLSVFSRKRPKKSTLKSPANSLRYVRKTISAELGRRVHAYGVVRQQQRVLRRVLRRVSEGFLPVGFLEVGFQKVPRTSPRRVQPLRAKFLRNPLLATVARLQNEVGTNYFFRGTNFLTKNVGVWPPVL